MSGLSYSQDVRYSFVGALCPPVFFMKGFTMSSLSPKKTALLVVHLQPDIVSAGTAFGDIFNAQVVAGNILQQCDTAMASVRDAGGVVVPLRITFKQDYSDLAPTIPLLHMVQQAGCLKDGDPGAALVDDVTVADSDIMLAHQRPGPFTDTNLHELLQERGIENVVVCGVATNASVEGAARQASDLGYRTHVLSDASSAADEAAHEASLASLGLFAPAMTVSELQEQLAGE